MASVTKRTTVPAAKNDYPFAYWGEGSARPIRQKDGLLALVVLADPATPAELKAVAATAPPRMRAFVRTGKRWLSLETDDLLTGHAQLARALTAWIQEVHAKRKVALFFVGSDGKRGPWHVDTVARFGERVRPVLDVLRAESSGKAHADWIARSFQQAGVPATYDDIRALAEDDPPGYAGDLSQRYALTRPLVLALGPSSLSALGPYGELGFWARASRERVLAPDPTAHAAHLVRLADACPKKRRPAVKLLLIAAASGLLREKEATGRTALPAALVLAKWVAADVPLWIGFLETVVDAAREYGGPAAAVDMARPFARETLAIARESDDRDDGLRVTSFTKLLARDLEKSPDPKLEALVATKTAR